MTRRFSHVSARLTGLLIGVAMAGTLLAANGFGAQAKPVAHGAGAKAFTVSLVNTDFGSVGAKGRFSAKLGSTGHVVAALMSVVSGVPYTQIAKGGTYMAEVAPTGGGGLAVVSFSDHALGKACLRWSATAGKYNPALGYLVAHGSLKMVGGTGAAARWTGAITFKQTGLTGRDTLQFAGLVTASTGRRHGMTAACRAVTRLKQ